MNVFSFMIGSKNKKEDIIEIPQYDDLARVWRVSELEGVFDVSRQSVFKPPRVDIEINSLDQYAFWDKHLIFIHTDDMPELIYTPPWWTYIMGTAVGGWRKDCFIHIKGVGSYKVHYLAISQPHAVGLNVEKIG